MSKYAEMAKGKLSAGREKASDFKGKAKGKVTKHIPGRGNKDDSSDGPSHVAAPLSSLRDPNSFAPPPKRTGSALAPPPPPSTAKRSVIMAPSKYQDPHGPKVEPPPKFADERQLQAYESGGEAQPASSSSPRPYRVDTTGLSTQHLPPPPVRRDRDAAGGRSPPSYDSVVGASSGDAKAPSLPPRLPPRSGSGTPDRTASPLSTLGVSSSNLNQGAVKRLGAAGISVPAFGIGSSSSSPSHADADDAAAGPPKPPRPNATPPSQLNELQNRFARLGTSTTVPSEPAASPTTAPAATWAQKQAAIKAAAATPPSPSGSVLGLAGKKKPPPPPPKKKPSLSASPAAAAQGQGPAPPPIPLSTRPSF
ncbi:hypothetical protein BBK36DRAFT_1159575 [Trichoderma citrinoviride]|uniref:Uncharacterized protein n=1 Tax=Trichoderma citrinoviride TaxID=58853 RepID=A0A2T4BB46_9HYPO|nr:hypothetical protein BBK36DRAFT_1159575 [Trichoderma citrinoviride]PTB66544.1 hypothetical protein BBK36DRAFT_1159575 [Trichoderma citrinoviride]